MLVRGSRLVDLSEEKVVRHLERIDLYMLYERTCTLCVEQEFLCGRLGGNVGKRRDEVGGATVPQVEWGETGRHVDGVHELEVDYGEGTRPALLVTCDMVTQHLNDRLV